MAEVYTAYPEPLTVQAIEGEVVITGPNAVAIAITPEAAAESARRLAAAAVEASVQLESPPAVDDPA